MDRLLESITYEINISPLVKAIRTNSAVIYVGAGASIPSGLPSWRKLLEECLWRAEEKFPSPTKWLLTDKFLQDGDFLMCAELLQKALGPQLAEYIREIYGNNTSPSLIHREISRIPFSLGVTTNHDKLLESCYSSNTDVFTWKNPEDIFRTVKQNKFAVIKIHGDLSFNDSIVLTRTQYRNLIHKNKAFNDSLSILLSLKTFLFVGSSLRDHDLLRLMDNARLTFGESFGPHYAILFEDEVDNLFIQYLKEEYNIHVIQCKKPANTQDTDWRTASVCSYLKDLSGKVSSNFIKNEKLMELDSPTFNLREMVNSVIWDVAVKTGSERGVVALVQDINLQGLYIASNIIRKNFQESPDQNEANDIDSSSSLKMSKPFVSPTSLLGNLFLKGGNEERYIYVKDLNEEKRDSVFSSRKIDNKNSSYSKTKSVLACQILADGQKVGVISLGANSIDAYTKDHLNAIRIAALYIGAIYTEYRHRTLSSRGIEPYLSEMTAFQELMDMSRQLRPLNVSYLIYEVDYENGIIMAKHDSSIVVIDKPDQEFGYRFKEQSLATKVLSGRREISIGDAQEDINSENPILSQKGVSYFNIRGPVYGVPIRVDGHISTVLIAWSRDENKKLLDLKDRISRLAHLIANAPDPNHELKSLESRISYQFFNELNNNLKKIDSNKNWDNSLSNEEFRWGLIREIMKTLTHKSCGLARVRLWEYIDSDSPHFKCLYSFTITEATMHGNDQENAYRGIEVEGSDIYINHTIKRAEKNPFALIQHRSMFNQIDKYFEVLDKNPDGTWIICPIIKRKILLGKISVDNHYPNEVSSSHGNQVLEKRVSENVQNFQRCCVELAADLLVNILRYHRILRIRSDKSMQ